MKSLSSSNEMYPVSLNQICFWIRFLDFVQLIEESADTEEHEIAMMPPDEDQNVTDDEHVGKTFHHITCMHIIGYIWSVSCFVYTRMLYVRPTCHALINCTVI